MGTLPTPQLSAGPYGGFELWGYYLPLSCLQGRMKGSSYGGITYPSAVCRAVGRVRFMGALPTPQLSAGPFGGFELWGHYLPLSCLQGRIEGSSYGGITYPSAVCRVVWRGPVVGVLPTPQLYAGPYGGVQLRGH